MGLAMTVLRPCLALLLFTPGLALAQDDIDTRIRQEAVAFVAVEAEGASAEQQAAIVDCVMGQFAGLSEADKTAILAADDFEDSLDALVGIAPEREDALENCFG